MNNTPKIPLYVAIARAIESCDNAHKSGNTEWKLRHEERAEELVKRAPSGSGIDNGTKLVDTSTPKRLVFQADYHHMNDDGMYVDWTDHQVIVTASLTSGFDLRITGRNKAEVNDYLHEVYDSALRELVDEYPTQRISDDPTAVSTG